MQLDLMHESYQDAVKEVAVVCGGTKALAAYLWPSKSAASAQTHLLDCLNPDRPHKLAPEELMLIARVGRERGCDAVARFFCAEAGYQPPMALNPEKERDQLRGRIADGLDFLKANMARLERLEGATNGAR